MTVKDNADSVRLSRRALMRMLGVSAGLGAVAKMGLIDVSVGAQRAPSPVKVPPGAIIRTVLGDLDPNKLAGATLMHEHLGNGLPGRGGGPPDRPNQNEAWMSEELSIIHKRNNLGCIVAANTSIPPPEILDYLKRLSQQSAVQIVATGAYYGAQSYPPAVKDGSEEEVADGLVKAAAAGHYGAFGEMGVANNEADLSPEEKKVFRAVARANARTGLPIFTHNNYSTGPNVPMDIALRQLDQIEAGGANLANVAIGHVCCLNDPKAEIMKQIAKRGAFVAFDRVTRQQQWVTDDQRVTMIKAFLDAGFIDHLLLASDNIGALNANVGEKGFYPGPLHAREGGPGYARPLALFVPLLAKNGIKDDVIRHITEDNPRRFLAFVPKTTAAAQ